ncbi:DUF1501 domain-containing protein [Singulisphaera acidiphila]|uniref:DUF1501 domain-containing protein n=1 Tax=Singulisphaera acidiphila (strain ATCC BAA-1392 / DSM 18658 / VKM B-2454 / MOB10) TaxID=886293 RepID=L0DAM2_SINAD|nr:DUF1501 domain-containing protein [Singulisphaera acidiphila]AGA25895.1 hypothetical protein Sinac_1515 [Singulisphaera acidiphila DSM 18658]
MIRVDADKSVRFCDGLSRRDFLHAGSLACLGLGLPGLQALEARGAVAKQRDMNCILLFLVGGPSQLDTWDMKPDAPEEIRGPFRPIETNVPGLWVSEIFPRMARMMDKVALVRSVNHTAAAVHDTGHQMMQTGRLFTGGIEHPHYGSALAKLKGPNGDTPAHVLLPRPIGPTGGNMPHGQSAGYLGKTFDPFVLNADPNDKAFKVPDLLPPDYVTAVREARRRSLRSAIDGAVGSFEASADARLLDANFEGAFKLMSSPAAREAFDLKSEPEELRDRYGRTRFGQSCLLARRLVERGVRFVTVNMFETVFNEITWDIHGSAPFSPIECYKNEVGPNFDNAFTALLGDLSKRGMLDNTMILAFGEFGRTPKVNPAGGRDHHPACWTSVFAGGPFKGGQAIGASDEIGYAPKDRPVTPAEIAATVYQGLGISLDTELPGPQSRPLRIVDHGVEPISELF